MTTAKQFQLHDDHQSGRFDATIRERLAMNHQVAQTADVALITEYQGLSWLIQGWDQHGTESRIVWDMSAWSKVHQGHVDITTPEWKRGTSPRSSLTIPWVLLRSREHPSITLFRSGGHTPAHLTDPRQKAANEAIMAGLGPAFGPLLDSHKPSQVSMSFDFNRDLTLHRNQVLINHAVHALGLHLLVPPGTTHKPNHRIDGFLVSGRSTVVHDKQEMLQWMPGYDHRGIHRSRSVAL